MRSMRDGSAIAVVGISCRVPGAGSPDAFWRLLRDGKSAICEVPPDRWDAEQLLEVGELAPGVRYGGFLDQIDRFDCAFFGISPREAAAMDPQQRLMLELCWEAFEDARVVPSGLAGSHTGVFVGAISSDYADLQHGRSAGAVTRHAATGLLRSMIANRVSYTLGLRGPSLTVDTGQSSSLVAVHLACESLRRGESTLALACGVHLNISAANVLRASSFGGLSPDGCCFTFDARANGYVRGEGGGVVVLKPLPDALAAGDSIYCVIRASAVNNDGGGDGLTAPSQAAQEEVLRLAYRRAGVKRSDVRYVELHGTGTILGDRVEAAALGAVLGSGRSADRPLSVGSVKTNLGHLEGAAGIVGLLKAALCIRNAEIPPSLNFQQPSPEVPLRELRLRVQQELGPWPAAERPLLAGVSSFGLGGTNCHVVLGEPPSAERRAAAAGAAVSGGARGKAAQAADHDRGGRAAGGGLEGAPQALSGGPLGDGALAWVVSGRGESALRAQAWRLAEHLERDPDLAADAVGYSLATGRTAFERRAVVLGGDRQELLDGLRALALGQSTASVARGAASGAGERVVFIFAGQGSQWNGMALDLLDASPVFAERIRACSDALSEHVDWSLEEVLRGVRGAPGLDRVDVVQPVLFAVMVSLAELWRACGVQPAAVVGHSQGEIAAACVAGALSLQDAARIVAVRSKVGTSLVGRGAMAWIALPARDVESRCERWEGRVSVAAVNAPSSVVVSGEPGALSALLEECVAAGIRVREIPAGVGAGHSSQVEVVREELISSLACIEPRAGELAFYSTVTAGPFDHTRLDADYWYQNAREPVRFEQTVRALLADRHCAFLEVSPHPVLTAAVQDTVDDAIGEQNDVLVASSLRRGDGGCGRFLRSLATVWVRGIDVDWAGVLGSALPPTVQLPTYAFQRERHWLASEPAGAAGAALATAVQAPGGSRESGPGAGADERAGSSASASEMPTGDSLARRLESLPMRRQESVVLELVLTEVAAQLGYASREALPAKRTFKELGLDSLAGVELRNRLSAELGVRLPATLVFDNPTPEVLARHLLDHIRGEASPAASAEAELMELERMLSALSADGTARAKITARLQTLLSRLSSAETSAGDDDMRSATAEEVFDLIDRELGWPERDGDAHALEGEREVRHA
jgi:acyl transferase domain-containing protein